MSEENLPIQENGADFANGKPGKAEEQKAEWWEFTCRTCNGKFAANVYEPKFCLLCGADLHFE